MAFFFFTLNLMIIKCSFSWEFCQFCHLSCLCYTSFNNYIKYIVLACLFFEQNTCVISWKLSYVLLYIPSLLSETEWGPLFTWSSHLSGFVYVFSCFRFFFFYLSFILILILFFFHYILVSLFSCPLSLHYRVTVVSFFSVTVSLECLPFSSYSYFPKYVLYFCMKVLLRFCNVSI